MRDFVGYLGRQTAIRLNRYADQSAFFYRILRQIIVNPRVGRRLRVRIVIEQIYFTAVEALWIVIPICASARQHDDPAVLRCCSPA